MIVIPSGVVEAVAAHARAVDRERPGCESLGVLVCDGERVVRYARLGNPARRPYEARVLAPHRLARRGRRVVLIHSHGGAALPSERDVESARLHGWDPFGIYGIAENTLRLWSVEGGEPSEAEFELLPQRRVALGRR